MGWTVQGLDPGGGQIFHAIQTGPEDPNPASCAMGPGSLPGVSGWSVVLATHLLVPGYKWVGAIPPPTLCACVVM